MIRENQRVLNLAMVLLDVVVVILSLIISWWLRFKTTIFGPIGGHLPIENYILFLIFAVIPVYLLLDYISLEEPTNRFFLRLLKS